MAKESKNYETNIHFAKHNQNFLTACAQAKVIPTKRQASKFRRRTGRAWRAFTFQDR